MKKEQVENLIDRLARKMMAPDLEDEFPFERKITEEGQLCYEEINSPVNIGDVLEEIYHHGGLRLNFEEPSNFYLSKSVKLLRFWRPCGFTKSLQDIKEEDTEEGRQLFKFLLTMFPNES